MSVKTIASFLELAISPLKAKLDRPLSKKGYFCSSSTTTEDPSKVEIWGNTYTIANLTKVLVTKQSMWLKSERWQQQQKHVFAPLKQEKKSFRSKLI